MDTMVEMDTQVLVNKSTPKMNDDITTATNKDDNNKKRQTR
jgi:hypothetical protein